MRRQPQSERHLVVLQDRNWLQRWLAPALLLAALLAWGYRLRWISDDGFITLRVVDNILAGHSPVFNQGERVEAYTHPLWLLLLTLGTWLGIESTTVAVALGIVGTTAGVLLACTGSQRLLDVQGLPGWSLPFGALIFLATPAARDFITSGLETGLTFFWLGLVWFLLVRHGTAQTDDTWRPLVVAFVVGLGPLIRPDLALFSGVFLSTVLLMKRWDRGRQLLLRGVRLGIAAGTLPLLYQVWRMGYFAALVPNTAIAKQAGRADWQQGRIYLLDLLNPYLLWIPLALVLVLAIAQITRLRRGLNPRLALVAGAPLAGALLHGLYVVRLGGDFMHGRFLLPALFALLLPVSIVRLDWSRRTAGRPAFTLVCLVIVALWSIPAAFWLRVDYANDISADGIADERGIYTLLAQNRNPTTIEDYRDMKLAWVQTGLHWQALADSDANLLVIDGDSYPLRPGSAPVSVVALAWNIGMTGVAAGEDVRVTDRYGLADPVGSRVAVMARGRPGHSRQLPDIWAIARYADVTETPEIAAARHVLTCGAIDELLEAITEPLSAGRFLRNIRVAMTTRSLSIPADPIAAEAELCRP